MPPNIMLVQVHWLTALDDHPWGNGLIPTKLSLLNEFGGPAPNISTRVLAVRWVPSLMKVAAPLPALDWELTEEAPTPPGLGTFYRLLIALPLGAGPWPRDTPLAFEIEVSTYDAAGAQYLGSCTFCLPAV